MILKSGLLLQFRGRGPEMGARQCLMVLERGTCSSFDEGS